MLLWSKVKQQNMHNSVGILWAGRTYPVVQPLPPSPKNVAFVNNTVPLDKWKTPAAKKQFPWYRRVTLSQTCWLAGIFIAVKPLSVFSQTPCWPFSSFMFFLLSLTLSGWGKTVAQWAWIPQSILTSFNRWPNLVRAGRSLIKISPTHLSPDTPALLPFPFPSSL